MARSHTPEEIIQFVERLQQPELIQFLDRLRLLIQKRNDDCVWLEEWWQEIASIRDRAVADAVDPLIQQFDGVALSFEERWTGRNPPKRNEDRDREIVRLRDVEKLSYGEIASRLNDLRQKQLGRKLRPEERMTYGAVKAAYRRAREHNNPSL